MSREKLEKRAVALGNAILLARSGAAFYAERHNRIHFVKDFFDDILYGDYEMESDTWGLPYSDVQNYAFPNMETAVWEFCGAHIGAYLFRDWATSTETIHDRETAKARFGDQSAGRHTWEASARIVLTLGNLSEVDRVLALYWLKAVEHVVAAANDTAGDTPLKVEFERVYETDTASGCGGGAFGVNFNDAAVTRAESLKTISPFGFLNRAAVLGDGGAVSSNGTDYKSYMFGSNLILFDNDLTNYGALDHALPPNTDKRHLQRTLDMNDDDMDRFVTNLVTLSGGAVLDCPRYNVRKRAYTFGTVRTDGKRRRVSPDRDSASGYPDAPPESDLRFTSFNRQNNCAQFTFSTLGGRYYFTANLFWSRADDFCAPDLVYKRSAVSSLCQCERPALAWRACLLITPINVATLRSDTRPALDGVVTAAFTAFHRAYADGNHRRSSPDSRLVVLSGFLGAPVVPFLPSPRSVRPARVNGDNPVTFPACVLHRWLRAYSMSRWIARHGDSVLLNILEHNGGRAVIVLRPVLTTGSAGWTSGQKAFTRYMTYEDVVKKALLLDKYLLYAGYVSGDEMRCGVAYARGPDGFIEFDDPEPMDDFDRDDNTFAVEQMGVGGPNCLWRDLFEAPSVLYVDVTVLATLGFNPVSFAAAYEDCGRTFEHADPETGAACTVYCSVLLRVVDSTGNTVLNGGDSSILRYNRSPQTTPDVSHERGGGVLQWRGDASPLESCRTPEVATLPDGRLVDSRSRYRETVYDVSEYLPHARLIKITFVDPQLKHVEFAFFAGDGVGRMTLDGLHAFSERCERDDLLSPPVLYTIQKETLTALYGRRDENST